MHDLEVELRGRHDLSKGITNGVFIQGELARRRLEGN